MTKPRLIPIRRPETGVGEWLAAMVRGLDALEFLERSRELAAEVVVARVPVLAGGTVIAQGIDERRLDTHHRARENFSDSDSGSAV